MDANQTLHRITIRGLQPATRYCYRVISTEIVKFEPYKVTYGESIRGPFHPFTTLDAGKDRFSFIALNDRHDNFRNLRKALGNVAWDGIDLVFFTGDMLNYVESEQQIFRSFVDPCVEGFASVMPFIFVRGNHEARGFMRTNC